MKNDNLLLKLKSLKKIRPDEEWASFAMAEILSVTKAEIAQEGIQPALLQKIKTFVNMHNSLFRTLAVSTVTAVLIMGFAIFTQIGQPERNNLLLDRNTQSKINSILAETENINALIRVEIDNDRISEQNVVLMDLLDQRHTNRQKLQSIISREIGNIKIRHQEKLTDQKIELLELAQKANQVEDFHLAFFVLKNMRY